MEFIANNYHLNINIISMFFFFPDTHLLPDANYILNLSIYAG